MNKEIDYGFLTSLSKEVNCNLLGDCSGSTVSRRTTKGFKQLLGLSDKVISDVNAEHLVHLGMIVAASEIFSNNQNKQGRAGLLLFSLFLCYQKGKN